MNDIRKIHFLTECTFEKIKEVLSKENIEIIIFKGPHLAFTVYNNPYERNWADLDLLIEPQNFDKAETLLISNGFKRIEFVKKRKKTFKHYYQHSFYSSFNISIELHRGFSNLNRYPVDIKDLFSRKKEFNFGKIKAYGLSNEDLLNALCIHILKSYFAVEEKNFLDISLLLKKKEINWNLFLENANYSRIKAGTYFIFEFIKSKYNDEIPQFIMNELKPNKFYYNILKKLISSKEFSLNKMGGKFSLLKRALLGFLLMDNKFDFLKVSLKYLFIRLIDIVLTD